MTRGAKAAMVVLFVFVVLSLALNGYLIRQWFTFRSQALALAEQMEGLREAALEVLADYRQELQDTGETRFEYVVRIDQTMPIDAVVPFYEQLEVPIVATVPISQEIGTTVNVRIPELLLDLPVDIVVPVQLEVPIDFRVPVEIDRDIAIETTVPISLEVPIVIDLADTGLQRYLERVDQGLAALEQTLGGLELSLSKPVE